MAEITILVDGKPLDLVACKVPKNFHGAVPKNGYGDVDVEIAGKTYTMRIGEREWQMAETVFDVKGIGVEMWAKVDESKTSLAKMYQIALQRHQPDITLDEVGDLMDWRSSDGKQPLVGAFNRCLHYSEPSFFPDEEIDPKALMALMDAARVQSLLELKTD